MTDKVTIEVSAAVADSLRAALGLVEPAPAVTGLEFGPYQACGEREWGATPDLRREFFRDFVAFKRESDLDGSTPFLLPQYYMVAYGPPPEDPDAARCLAMNTNANATLRYGHAYTITGPDSDGLYYPNELIPDTVAINERVIPDADTLRKAIRGRVIRARISHNLRNWAGLGYEDIEAGR